MTHAPAWKRKMSPEFYLEVQLQQTYITLKKVSALRYAMNDKWWKGMTKHYGKILQEQLKNYEKMTGEKYDFTHPLNFNLLGLSKGEMINEASH